MIFPYRWSTFNFSFDRFPLPRDYLLIKPKDPVLDLKKRKKIAISKMILPYRWNSFNFSAVDFLIGFQTDRGVQVGVGSAGHVARSSS